LFIGSLFVVKNKCHMLGIKSCKQTEHANLQLHSKLSKFF
jgi:hypothetical protein